MGYSTAAEVRAKKDYSLAYNRASATLRLKHPDEFKQLLGAYLANIKMERELTGDIETTKAPVKHEAGSDGVCAHCGKPAPCYAERVRVARRELMAERRRQQVAA